MILLKHQQMYIPVKINDISVSRKLDKHTTKISGCEYPSEQTVANYKKASIVDGETDSGKIFVGYTCKIEKTALGIVIIPESYDIYDETFYNEEMVEYY